MQSRLFLARIVSRTNRARGAAFHDAVKFQSPGGIVRVPLSSPKVIGVATSRGSRGHQEDTTRVTTISVPPEALALSLKKRHKLVWDANALAKECRDQVLFVGIYDGHGGSQVSSFLRDHLHEFFESGDKTQVPDVYAWLRGMGGYFRRWQGGDLAEWIHASDRASPLDLDARATLAFLAADKALSETVPESAHCGATSSVALLQTLDAPAAPFFAAQRLALTVAHCGDTRVLLCATEGGVPERMTETHHPEARNESARLRRMAGWKTTDSFGESRWMGALANTRCIGDSQYKQFGVTPEPDITSRLLEGPRWAYMILVSDGITGILSDDEIVDLARSAPDPQAAAQAILSFAEDLATQDNATVVVVPLPGWGKVTGLDGTKELRNYRRRQSSGSERQRRM